jgi:hypothetical protein
MDMEVDEDNSELAAGISVTPEQPIVISASARVCRYYSVNQHFTCV